MMKGNEGQKPQGSEDVKVHCIYEKVRSVRERCPYLGVEAEAPAPAPAVLRDRIDVLSAAAGVEREAPFLDVIFPVEQVCQTVESFLSVSLRSIDLSVKDFHSALTQY